MLNNGFIIAWHDPEKAQIIIQRYDDLNEKVGDEMIIGDGNSLGGSDSNYIEGGNDGLGMQTHPRIAVLNDGGWAVAWHKYTNDKSHNGGYMWRYHPTGNPYLQAEILDNYVEENNANIHPPEFIALKNGGWLAAIVHDGASRGIFLKSSSGSMKIATDHFLGMSFTTPSAIELENGDWVITWQSGGTTANNYSKGLYSQRLNNKAEKLGSEILVANNGNQSFTGFDSAPLPDGGWVVTWSIHDNAGDAGVYMKRYDAEGNVIK